MSKQEEQMPESSLGEDHVKDALKQFLQIVFERGKQELVKRAFDGRKALELRAFKRDRLKMYEKLGREVEMLAAAGDIDHPGLIRGVQRIHKLDAQIEELKNSETK